MNVPSFFLLDYTLNQELGDIINSACGIIWDWWSSHTYVDAGAAAAVAGLWYASFFLKDTEVGEMLLEESGLGAGMGLLMIQTLH